MNVQLENKDCKRDAVLHSTLELIGDHGFHGTSMSRIAEKAGVAAGTIYHYFESKDELITELYIHLKNQLADVILASDDESKSYKDRFIAYWTCQCEYYINNGKVLTFFEQYINSPYAKLFPEKDCMRFKNKVTAFIQYGIDTGHLKPLAYELLGPVIRGSIVAAAKCHLSGYCDFTSDKLQEIAMVIWDGIKKQDEKHP